MRRPELYWFSRNLAAFVLWVVVYPLEIILDFAVQLHTLFFLSDGGTYIAFPWERAKWLWDTYMSDECGEFALGDCLSCGEEGNGLTCAKSKRPCEHHCNCSWTLDKCCWCGTVWS